MEARINAAKQSQTVLRDSISLILFDDQVVVPFENRNLTDPKDLLKEMIKHGARGGTDFSLAIRTAGSIITSHFDPTK